jgi:hypothetical protein
MSIAAVSIVIAAASVVAASTFYSFQIRNQTRVRKTDLVMRLYSTWDSLEFQEAFHTVYWADFHDLESALATTGGRRHVFSYLFYFYDQVGALLRRNLIEYDPSTTSSATPPGSSGKRSGPSSPRRAPAPTIPGCTSTSSTCTTR